MFICYDAIINEQLHIVTTSSNVIKLPGKEGHYVGADVFFDVIGSIVNGMFK